MPPGVDGRPEPSTEGHEPPVRRLQDKSRSDIAERLWSLPSGAFAPGRRMSMAKGQQRSGREARKPKKEKVKTIAANPSQKGGARGLENLEHLKND